MALPLFHLQNRAHKPILPCIGNLARCDQRRAGLVQPCLHRAKRQPLPCGKGKQRGRTACQHDDKIVALAAAHRAQQKHTGQKHTGCPQKRRQVNCGQQSQKIADSKQCQRTSDHFTFPFSNLPQAESLSPAAEDQFLFVEKKRQGLQEENILALSGIALGQHGAAPHNGTAAFGNQCFDGVHAAAGADHIIH